MVEAKGKNLKNGIGIIHIVCTHKGGGEGSSQMRTIAYKGTGRKVQGCVRAQKKFFLDHRILKLFFFCTKEAISLPFIIVYRKV